MVKVTEKQVEIMIKFREEGLSYREIERIMGPDFSVSLIFYHVKKNKN